MDRPVKGGRLTCAWECGIIEVKENATAELVATVRLISSIALRYWLHLPLLWFKSANWHFVMTLPSRRRQLSR